MGIKRNKSPRVSTVIGADTKIIGDLTFKGGMHIDGKIIGNVSAEEGSESAITVSDQGVIEGDIRVDNIIMNGTITGDVYGEGRVELASEARVTGTVYYHMLEMALGAEVNGQLVHSEHKEKPMLGYDGVAAATKSDKSDVQNHAATKATKNTDAKKPAEKPA